MFKNTASQKLTVLAFADAGHATLDAGERVTGDAANITCKIEQDDDGTQSASNDTNPTEVEDGQYRFDLTQAETNGDKLTFYPESSTAGVQVIAIPSMVIYTRPPNFSDMGIESDGHVHGDVKQWLGSAPASLTDTDKIQVSLQHGANDVITAGMIAANALTTSEIADGALTAAKFGSSAITADKIAADAITAAKIAADAIGASELAAGAVTEIQSGLAKTTDVTALNNISAADVNAQCDTALSDIGLNHIFAASIASTDVTNDSFAAMIVSKSTAASWSSYNNETDSLEAIRDRGDSTWTSTGNLSTSNFPTNFANTQITTGGYVGIDWGTVLNSTATRALTNTTISSVTGSVGSISGVTFPTNFGNTQITTGGYVGIDWGTILNTTSTQSFTNTTIGTVTSVTGLSTAERTSIANRVLSRGITNVQSTADTYSITSLILSAFESSVSTGGTWTIEATTGGTHQTLTATLSTSAKQITAVT